MKRLGPVGGVLGAGVATAIALALLVAPAQAFVLDLLWWIRR